MNQHTSSVNAILQVHYTVVVENVSRIGAYIERTYFLHVRRADAASASQEGSLASK